jgi:hypothetical protein
VFVNEVRTASHDTAQYEGDQQGIVQLPGDGHKVRDQIERQG